MGLAIAGDSSAYLNCFDFSTVPALPLNTRGFDSMTKLVIVVLHTCPVFESFPIGTGIYYYKGCQIVTG